MTKHALLVGVADEHPEQRFRPEPSLVTMESLLRELGGWTLTILSGSDASRQGLLAALAEIERRVGPGDAVLFYFAGHGGVVDIRDLPPPLGQRHVFYLATARDRREWSFEAVLDVELSSQLARIDEKCGNVSAILDCCYSARVVRGPVWTLDESPDWLRRASGLLAARGETHRAASLGPSAGFVPKTCSGATTAALSVLASDEKSGARRRAGLHDGLPGDARADFDRLLDPVSHPDIIRLSATSSYRMSFPERRQHGHLGRLTDLLAQTVREAGDAVGRLTWDALAHRIRERAIWELRYEEQWVSLAGPRARLLFSTREAPRTWTVGFVPDEDGPGGWLRAGMLQGVEVGDEWGLAALTLDEALRPRSIARMRVSAVELNRAQLEPLDGAATGEIGSSAHLIRANRRSRVELDGPSEALRTAIERSAWLARAEADEDPTTFARVRAKSGSLELHSCDPQVLASRFRADDEGARAALALLEDWARARALLAVVERQPGSNSLPFRVRVRVHGAGAQRWHEPGSACEIGERVVVELVREVDREEWFVSVILVDVAGRPHLLDPSEPDGRELLGGQRQRIGYDPHRREQGIELHWPNHCPPRTHGCARLVVLGSQRPLQLGHLVPSSGYGLSPPPTIRPRRARRGRLAEPQARAGPEPTRKSVALVHALPIHLPRRGDGRPM